MSDTDNTAYEYQVEATVNDPDADPKEDYYTLLRSDWLSRREQAISAMRGLQARGFTAQINTRKFEYATDVDEVPE